MWPQVDPADPDEDLLAVTEALVAAPSRHALLNHFHRYVASLIPDPYVSLWVFDEERGKQNLLLVDKFGSKVSTDNPEAQRIPLKDDFVGNAIERQDPAILSSHEPSIRRLPLPSVIDKEQLKWIMAVPISTSYADGITIIGTRASKPIDRSSARNLRSTAIQVLVLMARLQQRDVDNAITRTISSLLQNPDDAHDLEHYLNNLMKAVNADGACIIAKQQSGSELSVLASMPFTPGENKRSSSSEFLNLLTKRPVRLFSLNAHQYDDDLKLYKIKPAEVFAACNWLAPVIREGDHLVSVPFALNKVTADIMPQAGAVVVSRRMTKLPFLRQDEEFLFTNAAFVNVLTGYKRKLQTQAATLIAARDVASAGEIATVVAAALLGAVNLTGALAGFVALQQDDSGHLQVIDAYGMSPNITSDMFDFQAPTYLKAKMRHEIAVEVRPSRLLLAYPPFSNRGMVEIVVPISRDEELVGIIVLAVADAIWSDGEQKRQALRLFAAQVGIAHSELILAERAQKFQQRIEQIASEATASLVAISLAHEVKNAINVLAVMIERLGPVASDLRGQTLESRARQRLAERLDEIRSSASSEILRVSELANMVRDLTTDGSLVGSAPEEVVYLNDVVLLWARLLQDTADQYSVKITARYDPTLDRPKHGSGHPCKANRARLGQVIINLVTNALQASHSGSRIDLSTEFVEMEGSRNRATLTVRDYGRGMDSEIKKRAFEMFFSTKENGYGLGLPVVKAIVAAFDGVIEIKSEPGKGSSFIVEIPCQ